MLGFIGVFVLAMSLGWLVWQRSADPTYARSAADAHASYACQRCGRWVEVAVTLRAIRRTLLCPGHYHATFPGLRSLQAPRTRHSREPDWPIAVLIVGWFWRRERDS